MAETRRQVFKTSILSVIGIMSAPELVKALGQGQKIHQRVVMRYPFDVPKKRILFEPENGGIRAYDVTDDPVFKSAIPNLDDVSLNHPVSDGTTYKLGTDSNIKVGVHGFVEGGELPGGLIMSRWNEISAVRHRQKAVKSRWNEAGGIHHN